jgi:hypothetical protein
VAVSAAPQSRDRDTPVDWYTPPEIFTALGLEFDLDPCAPPRPAASWIPANVRYSLPQDGLALPWAPGPQAPCPRDTDGDGHCGMRFCPVCGETAARRDLWRVWLNPPYGDAAGKWVGRLAEHGRGIALVFSRTDAAWWQSCVARATAVTFLAQRVSFIPGHRSGRGLASSNAGAPSCLIAYGGAEAQACADSGLGLTLNVLDGVMSTGAPTLDGAYA